VIVKNTFFDLDCGPVPSTTRARANSAFADLQSCDKDAFDSLLAHCNETEKSTDVSSSTETRSRSSSLCSSVGSAPSEVHQGPLPAQAVAPWQSQAAGQLPCVYVQPVTGVVNWLPLQVCADVQHSPPTPNVGQFTGGHEHTASPCAILPKPKALAPNSMVDDSYTTVMIRNMPNNYTRSMVLRMLENRGFCGEFDFLYLPIDHSSTACLGYVFINFTSHAAALRCFDVFSGFSDWNVPSRKVSGVSWSNPHQGLNVNIERYMNSPLMNKSVPDAYKPIVLQQGVRIPFPLPTKRTTQRSHVSGKLPDGNSRRNQCDC